jgi:phage-related protein
MPRTKILVYKELEGNAPFITWLDSLPQKSRDKCLRALIRLEHMGRELRRPEADFLRDGICELRVQFGSNKYRILYFFHQRKKDEKDEIVIVSHGFLKNTSKVPVQEIELAIKRKSDYVKNSFLHTLPL